MAGGGVVAVVLGAVSYGLVRLPGRSSIRFYDRLTGPRPPQVAPSMSPGLRSMLSARRP